ncbi:MAG: hypothetical protein KIT22_00295 [Verrucomicrobiae bacterium]|nr:hypothetical protein [Verrucomicrobiae bacterium]
MNVTPKPALGNKGFNIAQATKGKVDEKVFPKPELGIRFACNVHPWMIAWLSTFDSPFFAVSDMTREVSRSRATCRMASTPWKRIIKRPGR